MAGHTGRRPEGRCLWVGVMWIGIAIAMALIALDESQTATSIRTLASNMRAPEAAAYDAMATNAALEAFLAVLLSALVVSCPRSLVLSISAVAALFVLGTGLWYALSQTIDPGFVFSMVPVKLTVSAIGWALVALALSSLGGLIGGWLALPAEPPVLPRVPPPTHLA